MLRSKGAVKVMTIKEMHKVGISMPGVKDPSKPKPELTGLKKGGYMAKVKKERKAWGVFTKEDVAKMVAGLAELKLKGYSCLIVDFSLYPDIKDIHLNVSTMKVGA
jgi:hypothetical protein